MVQDNDLANILTALTSQELLNFGNDVSSLAYVCINHGSNLQVIEEGAVEQSQACSHLQMHIAGFSYQSFSNGWSSMQEKNQFWKIQLKRNKKMMLF
jgi:hypothetical protein